MAQSIDETSPHEDGAVDKECQANIFLLQDEQEKNDEVLPPVDCQGMDNTNLAQRLSAEKQSQDITKEEVHPQEEAPQEQRLQGTTPWEAGRQEVNSRDEELPLQKELTEQTRFFDIQFSRSLKQYTIKPLQKELPRWHDLESLPEFKLQDTIFKRRDAIAVRLCNEVNSNDEGNFAYVEDIKAIPNEKQLVLISWIYSFEQAYYRSNHLQIILWDTISRHAEKEEVQRLHHDQLYNACGGPRLCSEKQMEIWHKRKQNILAGRISGAKVDDRTVD
ncbi:hypothetical protein RBB50_012762 [Rhinocladiella similis]